MDLKEWSELLGSALYDPNRREGRTPIGGLNLDVRARKLSKKLGIYFADQFLSYSLDDIALEKGIGITTLRHIQEKLATVGIVWPIGREL